MRIVFYFCVLSVIFLQSLMGYSATLVHEYRMDEASWNGSLNELVDSKDGKHGTSVTDSVYTYAGLGYPSIPPSNIASSIVNGGLCRVGAFTNNAFNIDGLDIDENPGHFNSVAFWEYRDWETDRKSTRLNSSHITRSRMPSSA